VEDFLNSTTTTPFSSVPTQFLVFAYSISTLPCSTRPVVSIQVPITQCSLFQVTKPYVIGLLAEVGCPNTMIQDIGTISFATISSKRLIQQETSTTWSSSIIWIPTASESGMQILCVFAIDR
ncbi:unnamed protein product, partial [Didymodactylos carnosus]